MCLLNQIEPGRQQASQRPHSPVTGTPDQQRHVKNVWAHIQHRGKMGFTRFWPRRRLRISHQRCSVQGSQETTMLGDTQCSGPLKLTVIINPTLSLSAQVITSKVGHLGAAGSIRRCHWCLPLNVWEDTGHSETLRSVQGAGRPQESRGHALRVGWSRWERCGASVFTEEPALRAWPPRCFCYSWGSACFTYRTVPSWTRSWLSRAARWRSWSGLIRSDDAKNFRTVPRSFRSPGARSPTTGARTRRRTLWSSTTGMSPAALRSCHRNRVRARKSGYGWTTSPRHTHPHCGALRDFSISRWATGQIRIFSCRTGTSSPVCVTPRWSRTALRSRSRAPRAQTSAGPASWPGSSATGRKSTHAWPSTTSSAGTSTWMCTDARGGGYQTTLAWEAWCIWSGATSSTWRWRTRSTPTTSQRSCGTRCWPGRSRWSWVRPGRTTSASCPQRPSSTWTTSPRCGAWHGTCWCWGTTRTASGATWTGGAATACTGLPRGLNTTAPPAGRRGVLKAGLMWSETWWPGSTHEDINSTCIRNLNWEIIPPVTMTLLLLTFTKEIYL